MSLQQIRHHFEQAIGAQGQGDLVLDAALLGACGLNPELAAPFSGAALRLRSPHLGPLHADHFEVEGDAALLGGTLRFKGKVRFSEGKAHFSLRVALGEQWSFRSAFPGLPDYLDCAPAEGGPASKESFFYALQVSEPVVVISSYAYEDERYGPMDPGLNFAAGVGLDGPLAFVRRWGGPSSAQLRGMIDLSGAQPLVALSVQLPLLFELGPVSIGDVYLGLFCLPGEEGGAPDAGLELDVAVSLGEISAQLQSRLTIGSPRLTLEGAFEGLNLKNLAGLAAEIGVPDLREVLPPGLTGLPFPELKYLRVAVDLERRRLEELQLGLQSKVSWKPLEGVALDQVAFDLRVSRPEGHEGTRVEAALASRFQLANGPFLFLRGAYPGFVLAGGLEEGSTLRLNQLLSNPVFRLPAVSIPGDPRITGLGFSAAPGSGQYDFHVEVEGDWPLLSLPDGAGLALKQVVLRLGYAGAPTGRLAGVFDLAGTALDVSAEIPEGGGLVLEGRMAPGAALGVTQLAKSLLAAANLPVPAFAADVAFTDVSLVVDTREATRGFVLNGRSCLSTPLPLGEGAPLQLELGLKDVAYRFVSKAFSGTFEGRLVLDEVDFTTTLALTSEKREVSFQQSDTPVDLVRLLRRFAPAGVGLPPELPGLEGLTVSGLSGSFDLSTRAYRLTGTAGVERFSAGGLTISDATGSVTVAGTGSRLEELSIEISAGVGQELVPELNVDALSLKLELRRPEGKGWQWHVGGGVDVTLLGLSKQTLRADASNERFSFAYVASPALTWRLPDVVEGSFERLELSLARDEATGGFGWALEGKGSFKVAALPRLSGSLGLYYEEGRKGFAFTADEGQEPLTLAIELAPGVERMKLGGSLRLQKFSVLKAQDWEVGLTNQLQLIVPRPSSPTSEDPIDQALGLLNELVGKPVTATLSASRRGVGLTASDLPKVPVPIPVLVNGEVVLDRLGRVGLDSFELRLGSALYAEATLALQLPEEINNVFGEENGKPKVRLLNPDFKLGLSVDSRAGLGFELGSAPINLKDSGLFRDEVEKLPDGRQRAWTRFELGPLSLRFGELPEQETGRKWWHVDLGDFGEVRLLKPKLTFNGASFAASGGFDVVRPLRLPTKPVRGVLEQAGLKSVAQLLPDWLPLLDLHVLEDDGKGGKRFNANAFVDVLERIRKDTKLPVPVEELRPVITLLAERFNQLPADFSQYLDITIPQHLELDLSVTPGTGFGVKLDIKAPKNPIRVLVPSPMGFQGLTLRKLSFGEILSGSVLLLDMDLEVDQFDLVSLAASLFLPAHLTGTFTDTRAIQQKLIVRDTLWFIIIATQVPIPIPVYFTEVGVKYYGLPGLRSQLVVKNNLRDATLTSALRGLVDIFKEARAFCTQPDRMLPADLFSRNKLNLGITVEPGFVQLPKYLGSRLLGSEGKLFELGVDQLLVPVANFLKKPDPGTVLGVVPLAYRNGALGAPNTGVTIGPFTLEAAWLFSTLKELDGLVQRRREQPSAFVDYVFAGGDARGAEFTQALQKVASEAAVGGSHEGVVLYLMGAVGLPGLDSGVYGFAGLLVDRERGVLTQFRIAGKAGPLLDLEVAGRLAARIQAGKAGEAPATDLLLDGSARLAVLGHEVLKAAVKLKDGTFTFQSILDLFPPDSGFKVSADVTGVISRETLFVSGGATVALPLLPLADTRFELTYQRAQVMGTWLGQRWRLSLSREGTARYRFTADAETPVKLLPELVELSHADDEQRGPALALVGPATPTLELSGKVSVPKLSSSGRGAVTLAPGRVDASFSARFLGRYEASLTLRGDALDRPASFGFTATLKGDVLADVVNGMKAGFDALLAEARVILNRAEQIFQEEWKKFTDLVNQGANAVRAGLLQSKQQLEKLIQELDAKVDGVLGLLQVNDGERAARQEVIRQINQNAQGALDIVLRQVQNIRQQLEGKRGELRNLDAWYNGLSGWDQFWNLGYYQLTRARLWVESEALPHVLWVAEQELEQAKRTVPFIAEAADVILQQLDRVRNALYDELQRHRQFLLDRKKELDHYNALLAKKAEELIAEFGKTVDSTARELAQKAFDQARAVVGGLEQAGRFVAEKALTLPFEIDRLSVGAQLGLVEGAVFKADADIYFNVLDRRRLATHIAFELDFNNLARSAAELARNLWDKREQIQFDDWELQRRESMKAVEAQCGELRSALQQLGPQFGETLEKKVFYQMDWTEMVDFYQYAKREIQRFPALAQVVDMVERNYGPVIQGYLQALQGNEWVRQMAEKALREAERIFKEHYKSIDEKNQALLASLMRASA